MKVLIISAEVWQDSTNGGNVLSNMFSETGFHFAQIYCNPGVPENRFCTHYYQITDSMVIRSFFRHLPIGKAFDLQMEPNIVKQSHTAEQPNKRFYAFFHQHRLGMFYAAKNIAWNCSNWKNDGLRDFILDFNPDVIFAPCYGSSFMLKLTRYVADLTGKKVISYISDDSYTLKQFRLSLYFWINRFAVRRQLRKTFPYYSLVYTMTESQKQQCERDFGAHMKLLMKSVAFGDIPEKKTIGTPIRLVYAGGIYLNRWKTLSEIAKSVRLVNRDRVKLRIDIYTANELPPQIAAALDDGVNCFVHASVSQEALKEIYEKSDIALHVESFDLKNRLAVRMSFSTKIVDCLSSGCAVMAVCDAKQGGFLYLQKENAAICISSVKQLQKKLEELCDCPDIILDYAARAKKCCEKNHSRKEITQMIRKDFCTYSSKDESVCTWSE